MAMTMVLAIAATMLAAPVAAADLPAALVEPYLQVQGALAADRMDGVTTHAEAIGTAAAELGAEGQPLVESARALAAAKDIAAARTAFGELSAALVAYAEKTKASFGEGVRLAYCPMVKKPWLTRDKTIRNPYFGASMLTCGSFKP